MFNTRKKKTKIVATLGPASSGEKTLKRILLAGVDVIRFNFSHGEHAVHLENLKRVRKVSKELNMYVPIVADLQGPKIRIGKIASDSVTLTPNDELIFTEDKTADGTNNRFYLSYKNFSSDVSKGEKVLVDDGKITLEVVSVEKNGDVRLKVVYGKTLLPNKGVNLPDTKISLPFLTEKDLKDLKVILEHDFEYIALSFVRNAEDITGLRKLIEKGAHRPRIIAKIEKPEAIECIEDIIKESDAVMLARGDLGVEVDFDRVPLIQKNVTQLCMDYSRPFIIATHVMETMIESISPTRAEVSDAANAVFDGADAIMLSGETSVGKYPVEVIQKLAKIITSIENSPNFRPNFRKNALDENPKRFITNAICKNASTLSQSVSAKGLVTLTNSGYTATEIASYRHSGYIFVFTDNERMLNTLNLVRGVKTFFYDRYESTDNTISDVNTIIKEEGFVEKGDLVVNLSSIPLSEKGMINMIKLSEIK